MQIIHCSHCGTRRIWLGERIPFNVCVKCRERLKTSALIKASCATLEWFVDTFNTSEEARFHFHKTLEAIEIGRQALYDKLEENTLKEEEYESYFQTVIYTDGGMNFEGLMYFRKKE